MEIILNFDRKELVVNEACNFKELHRRLEKLLGDKLIEWTIAGQETKWVYQFWPTYIWHQPYKITYDSRNPHEITLGDKNLHETIFCLTDNREHSEE